MKTAPRFHVGQPVAPGTRMSLPQEAGHHASRVLRLREQDEVTLFNGQGGEYPAQITRISRDGVEVEVGAFDPVERESPLRVALVQGLSSGDRMDLTIQKAVELGVAAIHPVVSERSVVRLKGDRGDSRREHWQRIAVSACEQCGRNRLPEVATVVAVSAYRAPEGTTRLLLAPGAPTRLRDLRPAPDARIVIAVGPEAGFSPSENAWFTDAGFVPVGLGPRVLRTETAGPAALAALGSLYGDG